MSTIEPPVGYMRSRLCEWLNNRIVFPASDTEAEPPVLARFYERRPEPESLSRELFEWEIDWGISELTNNITKEELIDEMARTNYYAYAGYKKEDGEIVFFTNWFSTYGRGALDRCSFSSEFFNSLNSILNNFKAVCKDDCSGEKFMEIIKNKIDRAVNSYDFACNCTVSDASFEPVPPEHVRASTCKINSFNPEEVQQLYLFDLEKKHLDIFICSKRKRFKPEFVPEECMDFVDGYDYRYVLIYRYDIEDIIDFNSQFHSSEAIQNWKTYGVL